MTASIPLPRGEVSSRARVLSLSTDLLAKARGFDRRRDGHAAPLALFSETGSAERADSLLGGLERN